MTSESIADTLTYDVDGRVATANDPFASPQPNASFTYDGFGERRIQKTWTDSAGAEDLRYLGSFYEELRNAGRSPPGPSGKSNGSGISA